MTPDFALSLSFSGITLLQRVAGGWATVGEVALDAPDLQAELLDLRTKADALSPRGGEVKLIIPNEQIRYLTLTAPEDPSRLQAAIAAALEGATPYAVADLAFDWSQQGQEVCVAAVARETLDEAEGFAAGHHFVPVAHVAVAPEGEFEGEVFFGPVSNWTGATPARDSAAVILTDAPPVPETPATPKPAKPAAPKAPPAPDPAAAKAAPTKPAREPAPEAAKPAPPPEAPKGPQDVGKAGTPVPEADPAPDASGSAEPGMPVAEPPVSPPKRPAPASLKVPTRQGDTGVSAPSIAPHAEPETPPPAFSSIRASRDAPDAGPAAPRRDAVPLVASRITPVGGQTKAPDRPAPPASPPAPGPATSPALTAAGAEAAATLDRDAADMPAPAAPEAPAKSSGFFSRRAPEPAAGDPATEKAPAAKPPAGKKSAPKSVKTSALARLAARGGGTPAATADAPSPQEAERQRMTVFGARTSEARIGGKPRFLGLMLTAALLVLLVGVAAWASVFLDEGLARFFRPDTSPEVAVADADLPRPESAPQPAPEPVELAALETDPTPATDLPDLPEALAQPDRPRALTEDEADATYAATGIWPRAPASPSEPPPGDLDDLYVASIDPGVQQFDAVALPSAQAAGDPAFLSPPPPAPADVIFDIDDRGLVRARPEGAMNADGVLIYAGLPPVVPPRRIIGEDRPTVALPQTEAAEDAVQTRLQGLRPKARPADIMEQNERASLQGRSLAELAALRPTARPAVAKLADEADVTATALAVDTSRKPLPRPRDISRIVQQAQERAADTPAPEVQVAAVAPRTVAPKIPSKTTVAQQATVQNAINLRKVNLIGVYGKPSSRRALVRLANGRYQKVKVGDRVDGGRVAAIGEAELRYTKGGRSIVLKMPRG